MTTGETAELLAGFTARAKALGVRVVRAATVSAAVDAVADEWAGSTGTPVVVTAQLRRRAPAFAGLLGDRVGSVSPESPAAVRDAPVALGLGLAAFAETGSVLVAEPDLVDRSAGMLSRTLVLVVPTADLRPGLDDAASALRALAASPGASYATIMTGPSRTADIERVLTVGVQGPGRVVVLLIDDLA